MFAGKSTYIFVNGGGLSPIITIYYDTDKTYVFANISNRVFLNGYYRISNNEEIRDYIENLINAQFYRFEKVPVY